jgi:hypothetical protein
MVIILMVNVISFDGSWTIIGGDLVTLLAFGRNNLTNLPEFSPRFRRASKPRTEAGVYQCHWRRRGWDETSKAMLRWWWHQTHCSTKGQKLKASRGVPGWGHVLAPDQPDMEIIVNHEWLWWPHDLVLSVIHRAVRGCLDNINWPPNCPINRPP